MSKCVWERKRPRSIQQSAIRRYSAIPLFHHLVPSLFHHLQPIITPPPSVPPAHQKTSPLLFLTKRYLSLSLCLFMLSLSLFPLPQSKNTSPILFCNPIMEAGSREVSDDVLEENAGSSNQPNLRSLLIITSNCVFKKNSINQLNRVHIFYFSARISLMRAASGAFDRLADL